MDEVLNHPKTVLMSVFGYDNVIKKWQDQSRGVKRKLWGPEPTHPGLSCSPQATSARKGRRNCLGGVGRDTPTVASAWWNNLTCSNQRAWEHLPSAASLPLQSTCVGFPLHLSPSPQGLVVRVYQLGGSTSSEFTSCCRLCDIQFHISNTRNSSSPHQPTACCMLNSS